MTTQTPHPLAGIEYLGLADLDAQERYVNVSPSFLNMLGMREAELLGQSWRVTVHAEDQEVAQEAFDLARTEGRGFVEIRALRTDSPVKYQAVTVAGAHDEHGRFTGYRCVTFDISNYKRNQEALLLAVESAPNGLLMLNSAGEIQSVNRAVEELFGYTRNELSGRPVELLIPERFRTQHLRHRDTFHQNKDVKAVPGRDLLGLRKDGVEIPVHVYLNRIEAGSQELILCTVIDIAERVRYEHQLELAKQAAEAATRAKSDFLARMSHEIRTPMNLIMGMSALLLESPLNDKQRQHVEISYRNVRRLLRLINGILDLSKVEAGKLTLEAVPFGLHAVLAECTATIASAIEARGLQFRMSIDPDVGRYWIGDAERLQQVLLNLIGNAVKFTARGKIEVRVRAERGEHGEPGVRIEVTDTGCGVLREKASLIFEAFQQAEGSMNRRYEGTGLGLAIARVIVQMMAGRIWVEEKPEPGAKIVFTAFFPPATQKAVDDETASHASAQGAQKVEAGTRILVAEDNPENVILLRAYLESLPLSLEFAANGVEAVEKRQHGSYDLILMDTQMPIMDGHTAAREIRAWETAHGQPRIPIVALTANALSGASAESIEAGCDGHVTKPVECNDLIATIVKFAKRQVAAVEAGADPIAAHRPAFLANRGLDLTKMRDALAARDFATIQSIGHNCKGTGSGYGFPDITSLGSAIETAAKALDADGLQEPLRQFEECIRAASADPRLASDGLANERMAGERPASLPPQELTSPGPSSASPASQ
ncbi:MAG TPA: PAS domain S-box protein [Bryobacteraceae bacterium]|nr:PAS domain S-box protein [Bryobacteraceae bacterium]